MKRKIVFRLLLIYLGLTLLGLGGVYWYVFIKKFSTTTDDIEFKFPNWKSKAIVLSYDDLNLTDTTLVPIMNRYGMVGTFFIHSEGLDKYIEVSGDRALKLYQGHEIGGHSKSHAILTELNDSQVQQEVVINATDLAKGSENYPLSFAYPFGLYGSKEIAILKKNGYKNARTIHNTYKFNRPIDWYQWHPTCSDMEYKDVMDEFLKTTDNTFKDQLKKRMQGNDKMINLPVLYLWGHSYVYGAHSGIDLDWNDFETLCQDLGQRENIWYVGTRALQTYFEKLDRLIITKKEILNPVDNEAQIYFELKGKQHMLNSGEVFKI